MRRLAAVVTRPLLSGLIACTALLVGGTTSAGTPGTWWVDDDGTVGATDCSGSTEAFTTIQLPIELADRGDTINVCPGVYPGRIEIAGRTKKGISLVSVVRHGAVIRPTDALESELVAIRSNRVSLDGFRLELEPTARCGSQVGVTVQVSARAAVRHVEIVGKQQWRAPNPNLPNEYCRYGGISGRAGEEFLIDDVDISGVSAPIVAAGMPVVTDSRITVSDENIDESRDSCRGTAIQVTGESFAEPAIVRNVTVIQGDAASTEPPFPACVGIATFGRAHVEGSTVGSVWYGIGVRGRALVESNTVTAQTIGILFDARGEVRDNRVSGADLVGIQASRSRARLHDNDARGNPGPDCLDVTTARNTGWPENLGTANQWLNNRGNDGTPSGLCTPAAA